MLDVATEFRDITFEHQLTLSSGAIQGYTLAISTVTVAGLRGHDALGRGAGVLAIPWAWPVLLSH